MVAEIDARQRFEHSVTVEQGPNRAAGAPEWLGEAFRRMTRHWRDVISLGAATPGSARAHCWRSSLALGLQWWARAEDRRSDSVRVATAGSVSTSQNGASFFDATRYGQVSSEDHPFQKVRLRSLPHVGAPPGCRPPTIRRRCDWSPEASSPGDFVADGDQAAPDDPTCHTRQAAQRLSGPRGDGLVQRSTRMRRAKHLQQHARDRDQRPRCGWQPSGRHRQVAPSRCRGYVVTEPHRGLSELLH